MQTNNHEIHDYSAILDKKYGKEGTTQRKAFEDAAMAFYTGSLIRDARKEAKCSQAQLAKKIDADKAYISRIENGITIPSVSTFYRIIAALGMRVEIVRPSI